MTRVRNALLVLIAVAVAAGSLAAAGPAEAQKRGGTLTIVRPTDPVSLEPNLETTAPGAWVYFNMLEGLLTLDTKMQVQPSLATSYEVMSPTRVRFKLRPNVKFHDGTPLNAAAVKFTYDRALKGTPPARWASLAGSLEGAEVVDNLTVDIVTREPYGPVLRTLAMYCMGIVSPTAVGKLGADFSRAPVGTGPFKFVEWKTNTHVIIERFPDYWGDKPLLDRVIFKVVPEEGARMIALQTGDADMVLFPSPAQLPALRKDAKFTVHETTGIRVVFAGLHAGMAPLDDVRVRQALLHAVDRKAIVDNIMEGSAGPAMGVLAPGVFGYKDMQLDKLYPFDRAKAKALLAQAGWTPGSDGFLQKGGQRLSLSWLAARGRYPKDGEITEAIQAMFKDVGVEAKQAGAARGLEYIPLLERASRYARGAGAAQPEPVGAREALLRGAGHPGQGDGVDPGVHDQGDHRRPGQREGLHHPSGGIQPLAGEGLARQVARSRC